MPRAYEVSFAGRNPVLGYSREAREFRAPVRSFGSSATSRQECLGSSRARLVIHSCLSAPSNARARDASSRCLQPTFSKKSTRWFQVAPGFVSRLSISPEDGASRGDRPLPPLLRRTSASISPARACRETATSSASVTDRALGALAHSARSAKTASTTISVDDDGL